MKKYTYKEVYNIFKREGYKLLTKKWKNPQQKLIFICDKGHTHKIGLWYFLRGHRCGKCFGTHAYTFLEVKNIFKNKGYRLLSDSYTNNKTPLSIKCNKGHITNTLTLGSFINGHKCYTCENLKRCGKNNINWNNNLSTIDRIKRRGIKENTYWMNSVYLRDNYTCQCCGDDKGRNLNAHHLEGYHWCIELRFELSNGITLCEKCHSQFHKLFGTKYNTSEQFYQFLRANNA